MGQSCGIWCCLWGQGVSTELLVGVYPLNSTCPPPHTHTATGGKALNCCADLHINSPYTPRGMRTHSPDQIVQTSSSTDKNWGNPCQSLQGRSVVQLRFNTSQATTLKNPTVLPWDGQWAALPRTDAASTAEVSNWLSFGDLSPRCNLWVENAQWEQLRYTAALKEGLCY